MSRLKLLSVLLLAGTFLLAAPASQAQAPNIPLVGVGSTGFFGASGLAAIKADPIRATPPLCGTRFWTGAASAIDARSTLTTPNIPAEGGNLWVAWDSDTTPTIICAYLAVDNTVGQRLFFGTGAGGNATLSIPTTACTTAGANKISFIWDTATTGLPVAIYNALMGNTGTSCTAPVSPAHFNAAFSDVRPEDSEFINNNRVLCNDSNSTAFFPPDDKSCMGFGPGVTAPGTAVVSSYSSASSQSVSYAFTGTDPISGITIPASQDTPFGAQVQLLFVNVTNNTVGGGGFGDLYNSGKLTNVNSHTLSALYTGQAFFTRDVAGLNPSSGVPQVFAHLLAREPQSGTYTVFEWQVIRQRDGFNANSQETGVLGPTQAGYASACFVQNANAFPTVSCSNPMDFCVGSHCGLRTRVIGTGQMISTGNNASLPDSLGYAFWSLGNFGNKQNIRYLTLDGTDALFPSYSVHNGVLPGGVAGQGTTALLPAPVAGQCGGYFNGDGGVTITNFSCNAYTLPTFDGLQSGNYRLWDVVRAEYYGASPLAPSFSPLNITGFVLGAQDQAAPAPTAVLPDIMPTSYCGNAACSTLVHPLNVFRSHYTIGGIVGNNGINGGVEKGGSVAGSVFNIQTEQDASLIGGTFLSWVQ